MCKQFVNSPEPATYAAPVIMNDYRPIGPAVGKANVIGADHPITDKAAPHRLFWCAPGHFLLMPSARWEPGKMAGFSKVLTMDVFKALGTPS